MPRATIPSRSPVRGRGATIRGDVAQLEEHCVRIAGVRGSSPLISTIFSGPPIALSRDPLQARSATARSWTAASRPERANALVRRATAREIAPVSRASKLDATRRGDASPAASPRVAR
jgi:hypothetical protein